MMRAVMRGVILGFIVFGTWALVIYLIIGLGAK